MVLHLLAENLQLGLEALVVLALRLYRFEKVLRAFMLGVRFEHIHALVVFLDALADTVVEEPLLDREMRAQRLLNLASQHEHSLVTNVALLDLVELLSNHSMLALDDGQYVHAWLSLKAADVGAVALPPHAAD